MQFLTLKTYITLLPAPAYGRLKEIPSTIARSAFWPLSNLTELLDFTSCCVARWPSACRVIYLNLLWELGGSSAECWGEQLSVNR